MSTDWLWYSQGKDTSGTDLLSGTLRRRRIRKRHQNEKQHQKFGVAEVVLRHTRGDHGDDAAEAGGGKKSCFRNFQTPHHIRSEERRVGKEGRWRWSRRLCKGTS